MSLPLGIIRISGADAKTFLQGQISCDMEGIDEKHAALAIYADLKGRVVALMHVMMIAENEYYLLMSQDLIPAVSKLFNKYGVFSKIDIDDLSDDFHINELKVLTSCDIESIAMNEVIAQDENLLLGLPSCDEYPNGRAYVISKDENLDQSIPKDEWMLRNIKSKFVMIDATSSGLFLPHYIGLVDLNAVSFTKGCFLGQEVIARMHYRGKLKQALEYRVFDHLDVREFKSGADLIDDDGNIIGEVVKYISLDNNIHTLLIVRQE